jgi:hypothetical protein
LKFIVGLVIPNPQKGNGMNFSRIIKLAGIFGLFLFMLTSCLNKKGNAISNEGRLLENNLCTAPCFQNITPGITTKNEAINIFADLGYTKDCTYYDNHSEGGDRSYFCNNIGVSLSDKDIVLAIIYSPQISEQISLGKIIEKFGAPDCYFAVGSETEIDGSYTVYLLFDNIPLVVYFPDGKKPVYNLSENSNIESVVFYEKEYYRKSFMVSKPFCQPWKGYGDY